MSAICACHRAFGTTEIQEEILLILPLNELLQTLQVCRSWANSTLRIRQTLYLEPTQQLLDLDVDNWKLHVETPSTEDKCRSLDEHQSAFIEVTKLGQPVNFDHPDTDDESDIAEPFKLKTPGP